jgi:phosphatidylglycerol lysyltransferase
MNTVAQVRPARGVSRDHGRAKVLSIDLYRAGVQGGEDIFTLEERVSYIKRFGGHCMSFSTLQPGMHYFDIPNVGYIAFKKKWGTRFALADPVCDGKDRETLIREFLKDGVNTAFIQVSEPVARLLHEKFGLYATQFGVESVVDLASWDLKGKKKQVMRTSINHARKEGIVIEENCDIDGCRMLTRQWMKTRTVKGREVVFLIRPMEQPYQEGTRRFCAYHNGELVGFAFFDPVYRDGKIVSYVPNISRFSNKFKYGIFYPLMCHAIEVFRREGVECLHLGLCPSVVDDEDLPCESRMLKALVRLLYRYGNWVYSMKGLYFTKGRFDGVEHKTFCAHKEALPLKSFITLFRISNII